MAPCSREDQIMKVMARIERSPLSAEAYFRRYSVPFSIRQFYRYRARLSSEGQEGLRDDRRDGNHRKLGKEEMVFLRGMISTKPEVKPVEAQRAITEEFGTTVHRSTMGRVLKNLGGVFDRRPHERVKKEPVACAGFELIAALAVHLGWTEHTARCLKEAMDQRSREPQPPERPDRSGRNAKGQFTRRYNQRRQVRQTRFASIDLKRKKKDLGKMPVFHTSAQNLERKALAVLGLPLVTLNGGVRHVNTALGNALEGFCGFNYHQSTLDRFLRELKYLGASQWLLEGQVEFWQKQWTGCESKGPLLCYYIDGNTKPVWSSKRVKKSKVTMQGRVMGCLEQVFVHDCFGRPIYFETYSGQGPLGVYTLSMLDKVERCIEEAGGDGQVSRVVVMDAASNSVGTLRAFAAQDRYHYITMLDTNQWSARRVRQEGPPERYRYGDATLYDGEIELEDSKEKGYWVVVRSLRIEWDHGKRTVLLTSLPGSTVGASLAVKAYFERWPQQELTFRSMKAFACLHRVAGYGKQRMEDPTVEVKQQALKEEIRVLRRTLKDPLAELAQHTAALTALIEEERRLRMGSQIEEGKRILGKRDTETLKACTRAIGQVQRRMKVVEKAHEKEFKKLYRHEASWMRLQGKEIVYKVDVELDQIVTYFRVSLSNICAYFLKELLGMGPTSFLTLMQSVLLLPGYVEETSERRKVVLERNPKDAVMMEKLKGALSRLNALSIRTLSGKRYEFVLS